LSAFQKLLEKQSEVTALFEAILFESFQPYMECLDGVFSPSLYVPCSIKWLCL